MTENLYWNLLAKKLSGEASPEELKELEELIKSNSNLIYPAEVIQKLWSLKAKQDNSYDAEIAFELHIENLKNKGVDLTELQIPLTTPQEQPNKPLKRKKYFLIASFCVACLLIVTGFIWKYSSKEIVSLPNKSYSEISTRLGSKTRLVLPDSSIVWLNAGSKLTYSENFGTTNRNTTLSGEAYFDVKKSSTPFIIRANGLQIKVLGTAFNVKSYPNEKTTETSLIRGRVEITNTKRPGEVFILNPNEKLIISNELKEEKTGVKHKIEPKVVKGALTVTADNTVVETSWVENKLIFQDESFEEVARKMERWYNVRIEIKDEELGKLNVGGGPFENETIQQALLALQIAFQFKFTINDNYITITR